MNPLVSSFFRRVALAASLLALAASAHSQVIVTAEPNAAQARFEEDFLIEMIDHHFAAAQLAAVAVERAAHDDLQALAAAIRTSQTLEVERLQAWLQEWYDTTYEPEPGRRQQRELDELSELNGDAFDRAFLVTLSLHHGEALRRATDALLHSFHADLIDAARTTLSTQADEVALMRVWLNQWYGITEAAWSEVEASAGDNAGTDTSGPAKNQDPETPMTPIPTPDATPTVPTAPTTVTTPPANGGATDVTTPTTTTTTTTQPGN